MECEVVGCAAPPARGGTGASAISADVGTGALARPGRAKLGRLWGHETPLQPASLRTTASPPDWLLSWPCAIMTPGTSVSSVPFRSSELQSAHLKFLPLNCDHSGGYVIHPAVEVPKKAVFPQLSNALPSPAENCSRIRDLGFRTSKHINMYGERFELVSDPFEDGACTSVHALSGSNPTIRTLHLPTAILLGLTDRFRKH